MTANPETEQSTDGSTPSGANVPVDVTSDALPTATGASVSINRSFYDVTLPATAKGAAVCVIVYDSNIVGARQLKLRRNRGSTDTPDTSKQG